MNKDYVLAFAKQLLSIDSPTGYTKNAIDFLENEASRMNYSTKRTVKGNLLISIPGESHEKTVGVCAHCDTLGLMVRSVKEDGKLAVTTLGSPIIPTLDSEYCRIYTREGKVYTGTIECTSPAIHVYPDAETKVRDIDNMEVRIDELVYSNEETKKLGIRNGDIIAIDTKTEITDSGFIKSRFLDDKISVVALFGILYEWQEKKIKPTYDTIMLISTYEEVGHGMSYLPKEITELLAVDMGCIGLDLSCNEQQVSICAKDKTGPYDYDFTSRLIQLAEKNNINYAVDIYPRYSSDVSTARSGGNDILGALIGPGVHASHGLERTHIDGVIATMELIQAYLTDEVEIKEG